MLKGLSGGIRQDIPRQSEKAGEAVRIFGIREKYGVFETALSYHQGGDFEG